MRKYFFILGLGVANAAWAGDLQITCMEMLRGVPSEPVVYTFIEKTGELRASKYDEGPLSTFKEARLGYTTSDEGGSTSFAVHEWVKKGETLKRTVRHVPDKGSKEKLWSFVQIYDFKKQTVTKEGGTKDSCYHEHYKAAE